MLVSLLSWPLYAKAESIQRKEHNLEASLREGINHIKKTFRGDEKIMVLNTYYTQNGYSPLHAIKGSASLFLQIPFFIAAYRMLSSSVALRGVSMGPISDLGVPDSVFNIGVFPINILPIIMTLVNILSGMIYSKNLDRKIKIQLYITSIVFLVLLYDSPSGLVLYWTLNNVFSVIKSIVNRYIPSGESYRSKHDDSNNTENIKIFFLYALCLSIFIGLLIPSDLLSRSVGDFLMNYRTITLTHYIGVCFFISLGFFVIWGGIFFLIFGSKKSGVITIISLTLIAFFDYFAFYTNNGDLNRFLNMMTYYNDDSTKIIINALTIPLLILLIIIVFRNKTSYMKLIAIIALVTVSTVSFIDIYKIQRVNRSYSYIENQRDYPSLNLSKNGQNVVIIMIDRAEGLLVPYIMEEFPELKTEFDGFTYYPNTLSFGLATNMGAPSLYGGYEYTPAQMNQRNDILLEQKHNEALEVLPILFEQNGYETTVIDPPYAGYMEIPDLSIFNNYPDINTYIATGIMNPYFDEMAESWSYTFERNLFSFSLRLASPIFTRRILYDDGYYNDLNSRLSSNSCFQNTDGLSRASGYDFNFLNSYYAIHNLPIITNITDNESTPGSFIVLTTKMVHDPVLLQEPDYSVNYEVDNLAFDIDHSYSRQNEDGSTIVFTRADQLACYQCQALAFRELGRWFDYLRENDIYDNTRIILVSDHGGLSFRGEELYSNSIGYFPVNAFNCLLMVKDFGASGFYSSTKFMTNAHTPIFALEGIINNPINPFTSNPITSQLDESDSFLYLASSQRNVRINNGTSFLPGDWYSYNPYSGDLYDMSSWEYLGFY
ncbi:MAG: YidC/Oxa1 family membrane protein insertase [Clostridiales bacterium]|nr:YidC/Oxa1 family membrane protein insertase [Clostridiales bacterium]